MPLPAGLWAVRMIWQDGNSSIGETYYNTTAYTTNDTGLAAAARNLMKARTIMMGAGIVPTSCRMSLVGQRRAFYKLPNSDVQPMPVGPIAIQVNTVAAVIAAQGSTTVDGSAAQGPDAVIVDSYGNAPQYHARKYMAGVPNVLIRTNPLGPWVVGDSNWGNLFNAYAGLLVNATNGWVMRVRTFPSVPAAPPTPVYTLDGTNTKLSVTCPTLPGTIGVGTLLQVLGARMESKAYKAPNGKWMVIAPPSTTAGNTTYTLGLNFSNNFPFLLPGFGTVQVVDFSVSPYTQVLVGREGSHRRGNSGLAPRGRRTTVQRVS